VPIAYQLKSTGNLPLISAIFHCTDFFSAVRSDCVNTYYNYHRAIGLLCGLMKMSESWKLTDIGYRNYCEQVENEIIQTQKVIGRSLQGKLV